MATFTITVEQNVSKDNIPYQLSETYIDDDCSTSLDIFIPVPAGETKFIQVTSSGGGSIAPYSNTINMDTIVKLVIDGFINSNESLNTEFSTVSLFVRNNPVSDIYYSKSINRLHSNVQC